MLLYQKERKLAAIHILTTIKDLRMQAYTQDVLAILITSTPRLHRPRIRHNPQNVDATTQSRKGAPKQTDSII